PPPADQATGTAGRRGARPRRRRAAAGPYDPVGLRRPGRTGLPLEPPSTGQKERGGLAQTTKDPYPVTVPDAPQAAAPVVGPDRPAGRGAGGRGPVGPGRWRPARARSPARGGDAGPGPRDRGRPDRTEDGRANQARIRQLGGAVDYGHVNARTGQRSGVTATITPRMVQAAAGHRLASGGGAGHAA